jgi:hypothetical protein
VKRRKWGSFAGLTACCVISNLQVSACQIWIPNTFEEHMEAFEEKFRFEEKLSLASFSGQLMTLESNEVLDIAGGLSVLCGMVKLLGLQSHKRLTRPLTGTEMIRVCFRYEMYPSEACAFPPPVIGSVIGVKARELSGRTDYFALETHELITIQQLPEVAQNVKITDGARAQAEWSPFLTRETSPAQ